MATVIILHISLFLYFQPNTFRISIFHESFHLVSCLPLRIFTGAGKSVILPSSSSHARPTSVFSPLLQLIHISDPLTCSLLMLSFSIRDSTHSPQHLLLIHMHSPFLVLRCGSCICPHTPMRLPMLAIRCTVMYGLLFRSSHFGFDPRLCAAFFFLVHIIVYD